LRIDTDISALRRTRWHEYLLRFVLGGAVTVLAGLIADRFGPGVGGLFLAFPAIFPASATLISSHEKEKKARRGLSGTERGRQLAATDAAGATMGAVGLIAFAVVAWCILPKHATPIAIACASAAWLSVSLLLWLAREHRRFLFANLSTTRLRSRQQSHSVHSHRRSH
jgi:Protein of unknown function (DUF3147)